MLIFCCLIKSSNRSSGPSYIGMFILYGVAIFQFSVVSFQYSVKTTRSIFLCSCRHALRSYFFFSVSSALSATSVLILFPHLYALAADPPISFLFFSQPKTASRTRYIAPCPTTRALFATPYHTPNRRSGLLTT